MLKYPPGMGTSSQSPANVNRQSVMASGDNSPGDSTFSGLRFFSFLFLLFGIHQNSGWMSFVPPSCSHERKHPVTASVLIRRLHQALLVFIPCLKKPGNFKHCKRWLKPTRGFLAITEPFRRAQLHAFTLQRCSRSLKKRLRSVLTLRQ